MLKRSCETIRARKSGSSYFSYGNYLISDKSSEIIVKFIADAGPSLKNESRDASISSITVRDDKFKEKAAEVNEYLMINYYSVQKENVHWCTEMYISLIMERISYRITWIKGKAVVYYLVVSPKLCLDDLMK